MIDRIDTRSKVCPDLPFVITTSFVLAATVLFTGGLFAQNAFAVGGTLDQALCESADINGVWSGGDTCTITAFVTINAGETLSIPSGVFVQLGNDTVSGGLTVKGSLNNNGTITTIDKIGDSGGSLVTTQGGHIENFGTINNQAIGDEGTGLGTISQDDELVNWGVINNSGTFFNQEVVINEVGGVINNNSPEGIDNRSGPFVNKGVINSDSVFRNSFSATLDNRGTFNNNGSINNNNIIKNGDNGAINNFGTINNDIASAQILNDGKIVNHAGAAIDNLGTIDNTTGSIINECGGVYNGNLPTGNAIEFGTCDTIAPDTQLTGAFDGRGVKFKTPKNGLPSTTSTTAKFFFIGSDDQVIQKFQCSLDGGAWTDCTSPYTTPKLQAGITHVFKVKAIDLSGNEDQTPATFTWKINPPKLK